MNKKLCLPRLVVVIVLCAVGLIIVLPNVLSKPLPAPAVNACKPPILSHSEGEDPMGSLFLIEDNMGDMHPVSLEEFREASPSGYGILVLDSGTHELVTFEGHPSEIGRDLRVALWIKVHSGPYG